MLMKRYLLFSIVCGVINTTHGMEKFLQVIGGQQVIGYVETNDEEQEEFINITNQTGKKVTVVATYLCKTQVISPLFGCFGLCTTSPQCTAYTECEDNPFTIQQYNNTTSLIPSRDELSKSLIKLYALKARYAGKTGKWIRHNISEKKQNRIIQLLDTPQLVQSQDITLYNYNDQLVIK